MDFFYAIIQKILQPTCVCCGSIFQKNHLFCDWCYSQKITKLCFIKQNPNIKNHYYLIDWVPGQSDLLSHYIYQLKGIKAKLAWEHYGKTFTFAGQFDLIVPIPGSSFSSKHSDFFASSLAKKMNLPVLNLLKQTPTVVPQKRKNIKQRKAASIEFNEVFTIESFKGKRFLIVDDILTTGSSMSRAIQLLTDAESVTLFTLFYRQEKSSL